MYLELGEEAQGEECEEAEVGRHGDGGVPGARLLHPQREHRTTPHHTALSAPIEEALTGSEAAQGWCQATLAEAGDQSPRGFAAVERPSLAHSHTGFLCSCTPLTSISIFFSRSGKASLCTLHVL